MGPAWAGTVAAETIGRLTAWFQPTPALDEVVARSREARYVEVVSRVRQVGAGGSACAPDVTEGSVPPISSMLWPSFPGDAFDRGRVDAVDQLARVPARLRRNGRRFQQAFTEDEKRELDSLELEVFGPCAWLGGVEAIRVVIDGLDQLATASIAAAVHAALLALVTDPGLSPAGWL